MAGWRFLLDENVDPKVARYLEKEGLSAEHVRGALGQVQTTRTTSSRTHVSAIRLSSQATCRILRLFRIPFTSA